MPNYFPSERIYNPNTSNLDFYIPTNTIPITNKTFPTSLDAYIPTDKTTLTGRPTVLSGDFMKDNDSYDDLGDGWYGLKSNFMLTDVHGNYIYTSYLRKESDGYVHSYSYSQYNALMAGDTQQQDVQQQQDEDEDEQEQIASDIANAHKYNMTERMSNFNKVLIKLDDKFCKNRAVYTMYFKLTMRGGTVLVDSTCQNIVKNCLISFTHKMNGSGQANTFTLELLFKPTDRSILTIKNIESILLAYCSVHKDSQNLKDIEEIYNNCYFQYGYGDDISLRSPIYYGTILDYDCAMENGNLRYTITGYCGIGTAKEYRISPKTEYLTDDSGAEINSPLDYITRIFEVEFSKNNLYDIKFVNIPDTKKIVYPGDDYKQFAQKNIFQVIADILSGCMSEAQYAAVTGSPSADPNVQGPPNPDVKKYYPSQQTIFNYYIDDSSSTAKYGTVMIYQMESLYGEENNEKTPESIGADCNITFNWFGPSSNSYNHIVKDWKPQFEGSVLFGLAATYQLGGDTYYTMTDDGDIKSVTGLGAARLGISDGSINDKSMILSTVQEYANWSFLTQYPYKASMTIIGCPCEVPITGKIWINAKMGNENHHSSGLYIVLGKTDKINSSGFFSEFELFKLAPGFNPDYSTVEKQIEEEDNDYEITEEILESNNYTTDDFLNSLKLERQIAYDNYNMTGSDVYLKDIERLDDAINKYEQKFNE